MITSVDLFAGGGGASEGIRRATGVAPRVAVNHCPHAIAMHAENHPQTIHLCESVYDVHPLDQVRGNGARARYAGPQEGVNPDGACIVAGPAWTALDARGHGSTLSCVRGVSGFRRGALGPPAA